MKKKIVVTLLILVFGFLFIVSAKANTNEALNVSVKSSGVVVVRYTPSSSANSRIIIRDDKNTVVYSESISGKTARVYNISALPEGEYFFEVRQNGVKTVKSIIYKKEDVAIKTLDVKVSPSTEEGKFDLILKNLKGGVTVTIFDKSQETIFEESIVTSGSFKRTYDLSQLTSGKYVFQISGENGVGSAEVSLEKSQLSLK